MGMRPTPGPHLAPFRDTRARPSNQRDPIDALLRLVDTLKIARKCEPGFFEGAEKQIHAQVAEVERELTRE